MDRADGQQVLCSSLILQLFLNQAQQAIPKSFFLTREAAETVRIICALMALLFLGFAIFWMSISYFAIAKGLWTRKVHSGLFWWSSIFPVSTVVTSLAAFGQVANSPSFKFVAVVIFIFLSCIYLANSCLTIRLLWSGEFLGLPKHSPWDH